MFCRKVAAEFTTCTPSSLSSIFPSVLSITPLIIDIPHCSFRVPLTRCVYPTAYVCQRNFRKKKERKRKKKTVLRDRQIGKSRSHIAQQSSLPSSSKRALLSRRILLLLCFALSLPETAQPLR